MTTSTPPGWVTVMVQEDGSTSRYVWRSATIDWFEDRVEITGIRLNGGPSAFTGKITYPRERVLEIQEPTP